MNHGAQKSVAAADENYLSDERIHARYQEICSSLKITPPKFEIKPVAEMQNRDGLHIRHGGNCCSIFICEAIRIPETVDLILVHELAHHVLYLAGYSSPGHAWVMLSVEQILFKKAGVDVDSISWDAQNNWPKHIFWGIWLQHVQYAYELSRCDEVEANVVQMNSLDIARWVLNSPPAFEKRLWNKIVGRKLLEMYHTLISDLRSAKIFSVWMVRGLLLGGISLFAISDIFHWEWLKKVSSGLLYWVILALLLTASVFQAFSKFVSVGKGAIGVVAKVKSVFRFRK